MAVSKSRTRCSLFLFFDIILFDVCIPHATPLSFSFNFSDPDINMSNITFQADAVWNRTVINLTKDTRNSQGRAVYRNPVLLWDNATGDVASFHTSFSYVIQPTNTSISGDGLAFFLSPFPSVVPRFNGGAYLGLLDNGTAFNLTHNHIVAVEFDTFMNSWDPSDYHIGIDINSIYSTGYTDLPDITRNGTRATVSIDYNITTKFLSVLLSFDGNPNYTSPFSLSSLVDLKAVLPQEVAVGFSAATGYNVELHQILYWNFNSTLERKSNLTITSPPTQLAPAPSTFSGKSNVRVVAGSAAGVFAVVCLVAAVCWFLPSRKKATTGEEEEGGMDDDDELIDYEFERGRGPQRFPYSELVAATNNFDEAEKLGQGGFGFVYKGFLRSINLPVAIKRISKGSKQGLKEYTSEINAISRLRHRNLVQLIGWCHRRGDFLLVYELMPNGSLDSYLYSKERLLPWSARYNIAQGLASALLYLHTEWEQCVVHRDIKPSNIMLDSSFGAKLGDFGLARLVDHDRGSQTTVLAGTLGYLAPECFITGKASKETDIFSFGVVLLEIACGRQCIVQTEDRSKVSLVEWVWDLYGSKSVLEAADERLNGDFIEPEMESLMVVGLWCAHPDYNRRPSIQEAIGVLRFEIPLPALSAKMPELVFAPPIDLSNFNYTSSSSTGASASVVSASAKSITASESSSSSLLNNSC
ncbi:L-type lectin-domain containing receptor kinase IX.1-like [Ananas comosus]|uniref:non-specific serine/threonine protein kinase n=1 Tax=Ananas comosus TaxID=4615 RepID=A0A6P5H047_ANACO|nr:L-type lectin-domain containing receptor kinase IX.1-like [Ananas comosus]